MTDKLTDKEKEAISKQLAEARARIWLNTKHLEELHV